MKRYLILCSLGFSSIIFAQGWIPLNSGTSQTLYSTYFTNENTGWVVGEGGTILRTIDGGANWIRQSSSTVAQLRSVYFVNTSIGWAVGDAGTILKTLNSGSTWIPQILGTTYSLYSVHFVNQNVGWAVGSSSCGSPTVVLKTINGGIQWQLQNNPSGGPPPLRSVQFIDINHGWIVGNGWCVPLVGASCAGSLNRTTNSGLNWGFQTLGGILNSVQFINGNIGWTVGEGATIMKSLDSGINWSWQGNQSMHVSSPNFRSVYFINSDTGFVVGGGSGSISGLCSQNPPPIYCQPQAQTAMYKTTDGGANWVSQISGTTQNLYSIHFPSPDVGYTVGVNGTILKYTTPVSLFPEGSSLGHFWVRHSGRIGYRLTRPGRVRILLLDASGKVSNNVLDEYQNAGQHALNLSKKNLGSYFLDLRTDEFHRTLKLVE